MHLYIRKEKHHRFGSRRGGGILWGLKSVLEQRGGQVAVTGIRQQGYDGLACVLRALGQLLGRPNGCTGADTGEHRVRLSQALAGGKSIFIGDGNDLVVNLGIQRIRNKAGADTLDLMGTALAGGCLLYTSDAADEL